jgi:ParB family chromosome partitioning protein
MQKHFPPDILPKTHIIRETNPRFPEVPVAKKRLGRGLDYLLTSSFDSDSQVPSEEILELPLEKIVPNPYQPRKDMDSKADAELAASIARNGLLQPIMVRKTADGWQLVAGERRWRACMSLEKKRTIPALVRAVSDMRMLELALIENVQRRDLNPVEQGLAYKEMADQLNLTHEEVASRVGKSRAAVTNFIRILNLPVEIQDHVSRGTITMGHARSLLALKTSSEQKALLSAILASGLSVRQTESAVKKTVTQARSKPPIIQELEERLMRSLGTKVRIRTARKGGKIVIDYYSNEDFDRLLEILDP